MKCPKCNSEKWRMNALLNFSVDEPLEDQFMYTCADCQCQYNPVEIDDDAQVEP